MLPPEFYRLVRLAPTVDGAILCTRAEFSCLLQAIEVVQYWLGHGCPVRSGYVFNENDFSRLVLRNAPEPGVRNDGSNHPGETLAPIKVASDELEYALLYQRVDLIQRFDHRRTVSADTVFLRVRGQDFLACRAHAEIG